MADQPRRALPRQRAAALERHGRLRARQQRAVPAAARGRPRHRLRGLVRAGPLGARRRGSSWPATRSSTSRPLLFRVPPIVVEMWATKIGGAGFDLAYEVRDGHGRATTPSTRGPRRPSCSTTSRRRTPRRMDARPARRARGALRRAGPVPLAATLMELRFPDAQGLDDLRTYVARAKAADDDGAIRLQASGRRSRPTSACSPAAGSWPRARSSGCAPCRWPSPPSWTSPSPSPRSPTGSPVRAARRCRYRRPP